MSIDANGDNSTGRDGSDLQPPPHVPDHELVRFIAKGGFGSVWLARNIMGTFRAVKVVYRADFGSDADYNREFEGLRKFEPVSHSHDDVIDILQIGRNDDTGYFFYVMQVADDLVSGQQINPETYQAKTLESELARRGGRLPFAECLGIGLAMADGLRHLNDHGLIHRDIKPANIIFVNGIPKIADIGLVTNVGNPTSVVGTKGFKDPEAPPWTVQADIYSLGKVLYEISFGKDRESFPRVPTGLEEFAEHKWLLELNEVSNKACDLRFRRYKTVAELHADLKLLEARQSLIRVRALERRLALAKRIALAAGLVLLVVGAGFFEARRAAKEATRRQAASYVTVGAQAMSQGDLIGSLPWFTAALVLEKSDHDREPTHRLRIGSVLRQCPRIIQMWFHDSPVRAVDVSPDGQHVVAGDDAGNVSIWDIKSGARVALLTGHSTSVVSVAYSTDGHRIATASHDKTVRVWNTSDWVTPEVIVHSNKVQCAKFSPDGTQLLTTAWDDIVRRFNAVTGSPIGSPFTNTYKDLNYAIFDPKAERIVTTSLDGKTALVLNAATGKRIAVLRHESWIFQAAFSPDGLLVATASFDRSAGIWDAETGFLVQRLNHPQHVRSIRFSPDGRYLVTACDDLTARLWNVRTGEEAGPPLKHSGYLYEAVFSPDGRRIITTTVQGVMSVWDLSPNNWLPAPTKASYSIDGNRSVTFQTNLVQIWDAATERELGSFSVTNFAIADVRLNRKGSHFLVISSKVPGPRNTSRLAQLWSWDKSKAPTPGTMFVCDESITNAVLSRDGGKVTTFLGKVAWLRDARTGTREGLPMIHSRDVKMANWDSKARLLLSWSGNVTYLWDPNSGAHRELSLDGVVSHAEFSYDGRYVVSCCQDPERTPLYAVLWNLETSSTNRLNHGDGVRHASFSTDGKRIVTSSEFKTAQIWEAETGKLLRVLHHDDEVSASAFSRDGGWVVTACRDGTARIWEVETGDPVTPPIKSRWGTSVTDVQFIGEQKDILMHRLQRDERATASLRLDTNNVKTLELIAGLLSGHRSDQTGNALPLQKDTLHRAWTNLFDNPAISFDNSLEARIQWHDGQAATGETAKDWFAVLFHLDRLIELQPDDQSLRARRDEAQKQWEKEKVK